VTDPAFVTEPSVEVRDVSVWFGQKVALSELSCSFGAGVTGLLGPNGAGKSTLMRAVTGLVGVNAGQVRVDGRDPPADRALETVDMLGAADRRLAGFSKGMRQRAKVAAALVTDPAVLVLDEPLNGADPVQRTSLIALFRRLGADGRTVIVSSHVLAEVERLADRVLVLVHGRLAAAGNHRAIRDAMDDRPRHVLVRADEPRRLAAALLDVETVAGVSFTDAGLVVTTTRAGDLATAVAPVARRLAVRLREVRPLDDSLESLFRELVR